MAVKRYDGSAWQVVAGKGDQGPSSSISTWVKTASGGETSLSGNDDNSQALSYTVGQELVFINGTLLKRGSDYTATDGTTITGLAALAANDVATVWTVTAFSVTGAIANTIVDAKGDLITASGADVPAKISVGANGTVLTADSAEALGVKWATPAASGKVLQVVSTTVAAARSTSSTSYVDISGVTASITPSSVSSKILVISDFPHSYMNQASGGTTAYGFINQMRDSTQIAQTILGWYVSGGSGGTLIGDFYAPSNMITMDEPATTSSITYKSQFKQSSGTAFYANGASTFKMTLTLMEIGA